MASSAASSVNKAMETSMNRLSTGLRINTAADDAAGVAIASRLTSEIRGTNQAIRNASDGQALIDTAEGAHSEIVNILQRMRELSVQAANDTNSADDRTNLQAEVDQLVAEIDRISAVTTWAGKDLLNGTGSGAGAASFSFQIGTATNAEDHITVEIDAMSADALGVGAAGTVDAVTAITASGAATGGASLTLGGTNTARTLTVGGGIDDGFEVPLITEMNNTIAAGEDENVTLNQTTRSAVTLTFDDTNTAFGAGDIISFKIGDDAISVTLADNDGLQADTPEGVAAQVMAAIEADANLNSKLTVSRTGGVLTLAQNSVAETIALKIDGQDISISLSKTDQYTDNRNGVAEQLKVAIQAKIDDGTLSSNLSVSRTGAVLTLTQGAGGGALSMASASSARTAIDDIDLAIATVNTQRANLGAVSNRLDSTVSNLTNISTNLEAGRSRIQDADFAAESTNLAKSQILQQASTAMLAQANASKQGVLSLLQG
jgi:flagellin